MINYFLWSLLAAVDKVVNAVTEGGLSGQWMHTVKSVLDAVPLIKAAPLIEAGGRLSFNY